MRGPRRLLRLGLIALAVLLAMPVLAGAAFVAFFDPNSLRAAIQDRVRQATGRELALGRLALSWSLAPLIEADDIRLANAPGGSEPDMLRLRHIEARIRLLPLLRRRVEVASLRLVGPALLLETDRDGRGNWEFARPAAPATPAGPPAGTPSARFGLDLAALAAADGAVHLRDGRSGRDVRLGLPRLDVRSGEGGATGSAELLLDGRPFTLRTETGPLARLLSPGAADGAWPVRADLTGAGLTLTAEGAVADPGHLTGAELTLGGSATDLSALVPGLMLRAARATARLRGAALSDIAVHADEADLAGLLPGLRLRALDLAVPAIGQPGRLDGAGTLDGKPVTVTASVQPTPDGAGAALRGLRVDSPLGDLAGDLAVLSRTRPALRGSLVSQHVDGDALRAILRVRAAASPAAPVQPRPMANPLPLPPATPAPAIPAAAPAAVIPDVPLPLDLLRRMDLDLRWTVGGLTLGGAEWHQLTAAIVLQDGRLRVDPLGVTAPGGRLDGALSVDAGQAVPPAALSLRAPLVAVGPLATLLVQPDAASGTAELRVELHGAGRSLRPLLAGLDGTALLTLVDGDMDLRLLAPLLGRALPGNAAVTAGALAGRGRVRCLALRADVRQGLVQLGPLFLDSNRLGLEGQGTVNLADEALDLRLRPTIRLGGAGVATPVKVGGTLAAPRPQLDTVQPGRVGVTIGGTAPAEDGCTPALAAARDGRPGPMPGTPQPEPRRDSPSDVLRRLLR